MRVVAAGLLVRERQVLACRRRADQDHPGKWEFPGGKVEDGERPRDALRRELREELAIDAEIGPEAARYEFAYPGGTPFQLVFHWVTAFRGEPRGAQFAQILWADAAALPELDFLEGDVAFVEALAAGRCPLPEDLS